MLKDDEFFNWDENEAGEKGKKFENYININSDFINGLNQYLLKRRQVDMKEVVEVFAGNGALGESLKLDGEDFFYSITDSYDYKSADVVPDEVCEFWESEYPNVTKEAAEHTVIRFAGSDKRINFLIMGAPPKALRDGGKVSYCGAYEAAKALYYLYKGDGEIIYIGNEKEKDFASNMFFTHVREVEDKEFEENVVGNYLDEGYFPYIGVEDVQPYLYKFNLCEQSTCDCQDNAFIMNRVRSFDPIEWENEKLREEEEFGGHIGLDNDEDLS
ncbi:hypothetical protein QUH71_26420 (plasmid) [Priestia aryabhattai]|uniref:hypothetical protein n=1 Tax=Priestia aryabhattai TaxID=412384 RepID=UPI0025A3AF6D|nr:hypothetical protein [Priestia aryabhattai]WJN47504.1 hypothetical protein QUH71_26420 [Priestia aryabhattai]